MRSPQGDILQPKELEINSKRCDLHPPSKAVLEGRKSENRNRERASIVRSMSEKRMREIVNEERTVDWVYKGALAALRC